MGIFKKQNIAFKSIITLDISKLSKMVHPIRINIHV